MDEETEERKPHWSAGIWIFHPLNIRAMLVVWTWVGVFFATSITHFCSLGFKRAETLAPFFVATLAAASVLLSRRFRRGLLKALVIAVLYLFAIWPAYVHWIHGPGRHHFPAVPEPPDFDYADVPAELNPPPKTK
jgi:hypothetical protein